MSHEFPIKRTAEEGHTPKCWVRAITVVLENERDALAKQNDEEYGRDGSIDFRLWLQDNGPMQYAESLLASGTTECLCDPISLK